MADSKTTREPCPMCGALPCDHVLNPADDPTRKLLAEGLDLCNRSRKADITPYEWAGFILAIGQIAAGMFAISAVMGWI